MLNAIRRLLRLPSPEELARRDRILTAKAARKVAAERYADAVKRGDCRDQHAAHMAFKRATARLMQVEMGR